MLKIIQPTKKSEPVRFKDIIKVLIDSLRIKWAMMNPFDGRYPVASSIAHCQIEATNPLRFFVLGRAWHLAAGKPYKLKRFFGFPWPRTIINPEIIWHGEDKIKSIEADVGDERPPLNIRRWEIIEVKYQTFFGKRKRKFYHYRSSLIQHNIDLFNCFSLKDRQKNRYN